MPVDTKAVFSKIIKCGYYGGPRVGHEFCTIDEAIGDLAKWCAGKSVADTKLFNADPDNDVLPVYIWEIRKQGANWILVLWNEISSLDGAVSSIQGDAKVGAAKASATNVGRNRIPGYASYYWVRPADALSVSLRFFNYGANQLGMQRYIEHFLGHAARYVVRAVGDDANVDAELLGYAPDADTAPKLLRAFFRTEMCRKGADLQEIRRRSEHIRHVRRKTQIRKGDAVSLDIWQRALRWTHLRQPPDPPKGVRIRYDIGVQGLQRQEFDAIVADWNQHRQVSEWDDYGFVLQGEPNKTYWLSGQYARGEIQLGVQLNAETGIVLVDSLVDSLARRGRAIMDLML
jgi:hypothetical protein